MLKRGKEQGALYAWVGHVATSQGLPRGNVTVPGPSATWSLEGTRPLGRAGAAAVLFGNGSLAVGSPMCGSAGLEEAGAVDVFSLQVSE